MEEHEYIAALQLARRVLDNPNLDPDADLSILARQFLRVVERGLPHAG